MTSFREQIGEEAVQLLHGNLDQLLDSEQGGWVIIADIARQKISDSYLGVCDTCVAHMGTHIVADAVNAGVLLEEGVAKLTGHKHMVPPLPRQRNPKASK